MAAEKKRGENTDFILGYIPAGASEITDRTQMVPRRFKVTSFSHDEDSEKQASDSLSGGDVRSFGEDGFLWGSGGFEMEIPLLGSLNILRTLLRDAAPVSVAVPNKTIVRNIHQLAGISKEKMDVVASGTSLNSGTPAVVESFADYAYDADDPTKQHTIPLTVTPSSDATLSTPGTPATIVITYTPKVGSSTTHTLSFSNANRTVAQTWRLPAGATITAVAATGWSGGHVWHYIS